MSTIKLKCNACGKANLDYEGAGMWRCPKCGDLVQILGLGMPDEPDPNCGNEDGLNIWDAADIWASSGKDDDYDFGYSKDELENALDD